jgi:hypothetical protein
MCQTRTGLAACANVPRRALIARFLRLDFAQAASPIRVLLSRCAVSRCGAHTSAAQQSGRGAPWHEIKAEEAGDKPAPQDIRDTECPGPYRTSGEHGDGGRP